MSDGSDTPGGAGLARWVIENDRVAIYLPRATIEAADSLIIDGYPPGLPVEKVVGIELNVPHSMAVQAAIEWACRDGQDWVRCKLPGVDQEVAIRTERIVGYVAGS